MIIYVCDHLTVPLAMRFLYEIRNTLLKKAQSLNIKVDKDYEIVHERMT
jgi:hypothetical protein